MNRQEKIKGRLSEILDVTGTLTQIDLDRVFYEESEAKEIGISSEKLVCRRCGRDAKQGKEVGGHCGRLFDETQSGGMFCSGKIILHPVSSVPLSEEKINSLVDEHEEEWGTPVNTELSRRMAYRRGIIKGLSLSLPSPVRETKNTDGVKYKSENGRYWREVTVHGKTDTIEMQQNEFMELITCLETPNITEEQIKKYRKQGYVSAFIKPEPFRKLAAKQFEESYHKTNWDNYNDITCPSIEVKPIEEYEMDEFIQKGVRACAIEYGKWIAKNCWACNEEGMLYDSRLFVNERIYLTPTELFHNYLKLPVK